MDVVAQHTCNGSRCDAGPKNTPTDKAAEGILLDCCCDAWGHGMPPNSRVERPERPARLLRKQEPCRPFGVRSNEMLGITRLALVFQPQLRG